MLSIVSFGLARFRYSRLQRVPYLRATPLPVMVKRSYLFLSVVCPWLCLIGCCHFVLMDVWYLTAVSRLNGENSLNGSSLIEYVSSYVSPSPHFRIVILFVNLLVSFLRVYLRVVTLQAHIEQWSDFSSLEIYANILKWFGARMGFMPYSAPVIYCDFHWLFITLSMIAI